ncbi:MAG: LacI family transcriptional regulator [Chitinophagaceae bacterium]|nr:LacI family transcriptional regulator [Chitinophagaceae bacterium]
MTLTYIARKLKINPATVSRALNNHPRISAKTKALVVSVAGQLNYRPNRVATSLQSGKSQIIGVMIPSADINFFGSVVHGIESVASTLGYNIIIYQTNELTAYEKKGLNTFIDASVDGIIASIAKETTDFSHYDEIKLKNIPLVLFDRGNEKLGISSVVINDYDGAFKATEHLIIQGYKRIAHITGPQHIEIFKDRFMGYRNALKLHQLPYDASLVEKGDISIEAGIKAAKKLLSLANPPDAIFAVEDFTALGAIKVLKENGIKIPEDFGIVGFANELFGAHITPSLSTIDQQTVKMGKEAFNLLLSLINQKNIKERVQTKIVLEAIPLFRESSSRNQNISSP